MVDGMQNTTQFKTGFCEFFDFKVEKVNKDKIKFHYIEILGF